MSRKKKRLTSATGRGRKAVDKRLQVAARLAASRPSTPAALHQFVKAAYNLAVPRRAVCPGHVAPMEYLVRAVLHPGRDLVVWASRGGAKTELGSVAAHLDSLFRPGCQTRILGGSLEQSQKMYAYLMKKWEDREKDLAGPPTARRTRLANGSVVEVLTQSARSVRGHRVHRLKCDELDEFSPEVWQAAQFVTQSGPGKDGALIPAQMEVFSTLHRAAGPMAALVDRIAAQSSPDRKACPEPCRRVGGTPELTLGARNGVPLLLRWCLWEVIEPCPADRSCSRCPLWPDCEGKARGADGYFPIDDAIAQKARASREAWQAEMLCLRPRADGLVFAEFSPARHVAPAAYDAALPLYRAIDFGYANPFVCLWVQVKGDVRTVRAPRVSSGVQTSADDTRQLTLAARTAETSARTAGRAPLAEADLSGVQFRVIGEYVARERPIVEHAREMARLDPGPVMATFADPAGWQRSDVTGTGPCQELAALGLRVHTPRAGILEGVELLRRLLKDRPAAAGPGLVVSPSCRWLIRSMQEYHWDDRPTGLRSERPAKDGADHPIDALRYLVTGLCLGRGRVRERRW
jgi:hypothetical protein